MKNYADWADYYPPRRRITDFKKIAERSRCKKPQYTWLQLQRKLLLLHGCWQVTYLYVNCCRGLLSAWIRAEKPWGLTPKPAKCSNCTVLNQSNDFLTFPKSRLRAVSLGRDNASPHNSLFRRSHTHDAASAFTDFRAKERPIAVYPKRDLEGRITILINSGRAESKAGHLELCPWSCARGPLVCRGSWDGATDWWSELIAKRSSE